jgi:hypothetical protein
MSRPELQAPPEIVRSSAAFASPALTRHHSIMEIQRRRNTRISTFLSFLIISSFKQNSLNLQHSYPADPSGDDVSRSGAT